MRPHKEGKPGKVNILASAISGFIELLTFHPLDTITKRLINHRGTITTMKNVIFADAANTNTTLLARYLSLYPGLQYAILYKVSQRTYQFGGHPFVSAFLHDHYSEDFHHLFGEKNASLVTHAFAGALIGIGEVVLLPLDLLKVRGQTFNPKNHPNSSTFSASLFFAHFKQAGNGGTLAAIRALYRGAGWTAARNSVGCFALFGTSALIKDRFFQLKQYGKASLLQDLVSSTIAATACVIVAAPLDVVKVRIQAAPLNSGVSGFKIISNLIAKEGFSALFKGLIPKLVGAGPKVAFGFTVSQQLAQIMGSWFS